MNKHSVVFLPNFKREVKKKKSAIHFQTTIQIYVQHYKHEHIKKSFSSSTCFDIYQQLRNQPKNMQRM